MPKPSIFILVDTWGTGSVGCYANNPLLGSPNIDALAVRGVRFDCAYTCSPVCGPARPAIFTGLFPHSNGVWGNDMAPQLSLPTLGQRLDSASSPDCSWGFPVRQRNRAQSDAVKKERHPDPKEQVPWLTNNALIR